MSKALQPLYLSNLVEKKKMTSKMRWSVFLLTYLSVGVAATADMHQVGAKNEGCLYSYAAGVDRTGEKIVECGDVMRMARSGPIGDLLRVLNIDVSSVEFHGCQGSPYMTRVRAGYDRPDKYQVFYPTQGFSIDDAIAPIAHELGHVYQLTSQGGLLGLRSKWPDSIDVELGADFLAGLSLQQVFDSLETARFHQSLALVGRFGEQEADPQAHGTLSQRGQAFRHGYFFDFEEHGRVLQDNYLEFTGNRLGSVKQAAQ